MSLQDKEKRILEGLARAFEIDENNAFEILKSAAEALGCRVQDDGETTMLVSYRRNCSVFCMHVNVAGISLFASS